MRSRILSLWLPHLSTDRLARDRPERAGRPLATYVSRDGACRLEAVSAAAEAAGLGPGTSLADAHALLPELEAVPADPDADRELLERLLVWGERYTPHLALDRSCPEDAGGSLWLDVTGCAHLFGGEDALLDDLCARLGRRGLAARGAIADAPGTAWALARHGGVGRSIVPPGGARVALAPLPVAALRLPSDMVRMLDRLGLARVDSLYPLPRQALAARFGDLLTRRLDQALGRIAEPISPAPPPRAHRAELLFAEPVAHAEALHGLTRRLLAELTSGLEAACLGVRRLALALYRVDNTVQTIGIGTSRPERDPRRLMRLFEEKLKGVDPGFGIERAILEAEVVEPLLPAPIAWRQMGAGDLDQARDLAPLVDRLAGRFGPASVVRLSPRPSHLPERAQAAVPVLHDPGRQRRPARRAAGGGGATAALLERAPDERAAVAPALCTDTPSRPLRLLARPEPIEAVAPLPDEPPVLFRWRRMVHKVVRVRGPERLAPEWWLEPDSDPDAVTRDYFAVEDAAGGRFWLFREGLWREGATLMPRWYLHGLFA
ncbi:MAG TPA: DNA polymerase Y family protein [Geminicoccaceae bacterium]